MGYTTEFDGSFKVTTNEQCSDQYAIDNFAVSMHEMHETRHGDNIREFSYAPSFYCQWVFDDLACSVKWDGGEKFYEYVEWLRIVVDAADDHDLVLNGKVRYQGERMEDAVTITIENNKVTKEKFE